MARPHLKGKRTFGSEPKSLCKHLERVLLAYCGSSATQHQRGNESRRISDGAGAATARGQCHERAIALYVVEAGHLVGCLSKGYSNNHQHILTTQRYCFSVIYTIVARIKTEKLTIN